MCRGVPGFHGVDVAELLYFYQTCRLGTGGMGFNWPTGAWEDTPMNVLQAMRLIDATIAEHSSQERQRRETEMRLGR